MAASPDVFMLMITVCDAVRTWSRWMPDVLNLILFGGGGQESGACMQFDPCVSCLGGREGTFSAWSSLFPPGDKPHLRMSGRRSFPSLTGFRCLLAGPWVWERPTYRASAFAAQKWHLSKSHSLWNDLPRSAVEREMGRLWTIKCGTVWWNLSVDELTRRVLLRN